MRKLIKVIKGDETAEVLNLYLTSKKCCLLKAHTESIRNIDKSCILLLSTLKHLLQTINLRKARMKLIIKFLPLIYTAFIHDLFHVGIYVVLLHFIKLVRSEIVLKNNARVRKGSDQVFCHGGIWRHSEFIQNYNQKIKKELLHRTQITISLYFIWHCCY